MSKDLEMFWRIFEFRILCAHLLSVSNGVPVGGCLCPICLRVVMMDLPCQQTRQRPLPTLKNIVESATEAETGGVYTGG